MKKKQKPNILVELDSVEYGEQLLLTLIDDNKNIKPVTWISVLLLVLAKGFKFSGIPFANFKKHIYEAVDFYEKQWDNE